MNKPIEQSASSGPTTAADPSQKPAANTGSVPSSPDEKSITKAAEDKSVVKAAVTEPAAK